MLSSTVVSNALPTIVTDLHGSQSRYTWVVVATLLPDRLHPDLGQARRPVQQEAAGAAALVIFVAGSLLAGLAPTVAC